MHIMSSMEQNNHKGALGMNEKTYKTMSLAGGGNIAVGIIVLVTGLAAGAVMIVTGARLLKRKSDLIF